MVYTSIKIKGTYLVNIIIRIIRVNGIPKEYTYSNPFYQKVFWRFY